MKGGAMNKIKGIWARLTAIALGLFFSASAAMADAANTVTLPATVDLSAVYTFAGVVIAALVGLIVVRKSIKLVNRS